MCPQVIQALRMCVHVVCCAALDLGDDMDVGTRAAMAEAGE